MANLCMHPNSAAHHHPSSGSPCLNLIMQVMRAFLDCLGVTVAGLVTAVIVSPLTAVAVGPAIVMFEVIRRRYIAVTRELNRLNALALSPILSSFTESLQVRLQSPHVRHAACCMLPATAALSLADALWLYRKAPAGCANGKTHPSVSVMASAVDPFKHIDIQVHKFTCSRPCSMHAHPCDHVFT